MSANERSQKARAFWQEQFKHLDARQFVVIDECGSNIGLTPLYTCAAKLQRSPYLYTCNSGKIGKNTTLITALAWSGMGESMIIEGSANALTFEQYVEEILAPSLTTGHIMDNLAVYKSKKILNLIQAKECQLLFLPGYSPDFSPIEDIPALC